MGDRKGIGVDVKVGVGVAVGGDVVWGTGEQLNRIPLNIKNMPAMNFSMIVILARIDQDHKRYRPGWRDELAWVRY